MKFLLRRTGALGDVVLATPIVRWLRYHYPRAEITMQTAYPDVFRDNDFVDHVIGPETAVMIRRDDPCHKLIDLDLAYERRPNMHVFEAYAKQVGISLPEGNDIPIEMVRQFRQEIFFDRRKMRVFSEGKWPCVAVHAARAGWRNRTLPRQTWIDVVEGLRDNHFTPILVGSSRDDLPGQTCLTMQMADIHQQARLIHSCACFVGSDSGLLHVAGATGTPIVGVFTSVRPEYRMPYRDNCIAVMPPGLDCLGCQERQPAPAIYESCERGDLACVGAVRADDIIAAVVKLVAESKRPGD